MLEMRVFVWVQPGAKTTESAGMRGDEPKIRIAARPEGVEANALLCAFLTETLGVPKRDAQVVSVQTSRCKLLEIPDEARERFLALFDSTPSGTHI